MVLIDSYISHDEFTLAVNEDHIYYRLKESIRAKDDPLRDFERDKLIEYGKKIGIDKSIDRMRDKV